MREAGDMMKKSSIYPHPEWNEKKNMKIIMLKFILASVVYQVNVCLAVVLQFINFPYYRIVICIVEKTALKKIFNFVLE
jgi:hypothetical protein